MGLVRPGQRGVRGEQGPSVQVRQRGLRGAPGQLRGPPSPLRRENLRPENPAKRPVDAGQPCGEERPGGAVRQAAGSAARTAFGLKL